MNVYAEPADTIVKRAHAKRCRDQFLHYAGTVTADRVGRIGNGGWVFHRYRCAHWRLADPCNADVLVWHGVISRAAKEAMGGEVDAEVERQRTEIARLRSELTDHIFKIERLRAAVQAVLDLHMPVVDGRLAMRTDADGWCDSDKENYPCTTIRALDAALGGERVRPRRLPREVQVQIEGEQDE